MSESKGLSIAVLIPYFGKWPEWIALYFETLKRNSSIDFHFITDCDTTLVEAPNIFFHHDNFKNYIASAEEKLNIKLNFPNAYKICDLRPLFGTLHADIFAQYDFYGWTDVDLLFGDIRAFYTDEILSRYDVFSTHVVRVSGHFALFRNNDRNRNMYKQVYNWRSALMNPDFVGIDEHGITNAYLGTIIDKINDKFKVRIGRYINALMKKRKKRRLYMVEQYSTPFISIPWTDGTINSNQPETWFYKDGTITNDRDNRNFMYIHFMNFKGSQWRHDGTPAPWEGRKHICTATQKDMNSGIVIDPAGIRPLI